MKIFAKSVACALLSGIAVFVMSGCATHEVTMDEMVVAFAQRVSTDLQKVQAIAEQNPAEIEIANMKNNSRYIFEGADMDILMKRLRLELNQTSNGKIKFYNQDPKVLELRIKRQQKKLMASLKPALAKTAKELLQGKDLSKGITVSCGAIKGIKNMNISKDSFIDMFRTELVSVSNNKVRFTATVTEEADYILFGEIYAEAGGQKENANYVLRLGLCNPETEVVERESTVTIQKIVSDNTEKAPFILSGEINSLSTRKRGEQTDYCFISATITNAETNEIIWEGSSGDFVMKNQAGSVYR